MGQSRVEDHQIARSGRNGNDLVLLEVERRVTGEVIVRVPLEPSVEVAEDAGHAAERAVLFVDVGQVQDALVRVFEETRVTVPVQREGPRARPAGPRRAAP